MPYFFRTFNEKNKEILLHSSSFKKQISFFLCHVQTPKRVFTRGILSWGETRPGMKSSLSMTKYLLLFTCFCRDEISSRDELIPVRMRLHVTEMKSHPGMKKFLFTREFHSGMKFNLKENLPLSMMKT